MIRAYIGLLGQGKTISMVNDALKMIDDGKRVVTNVSINYQSKKGNKAIYLSGDEFKNAFMTETGAALLIDEASLIFPNYFWNKLSGDFLMRFAQSRKYGLDIFYTSQGYNHAVRRLRDLTNEVVKCERHELFGQTFFGNIYYNPEYFEQRIISSIEIEKRYILKRKLIGPRNVKKLYRIYDTMQKIDSSFLTNITIGEQYKEATASAGDSII